jgi:O-antigen/teichoic acid export membrane protein
MKKLTKNFIWMAAANAVSGCINVLLYIYLARRLGAEKFGQFSYAQAIVLYLYNFIDLGLSIFGTREIAKDKSRLGEYVRRIISLRFVIGSILFIIFTAAVIFSRQVLEMKLLMILMALGLLSACLATEWAFQGIEKMHMVFISLVTTSFLQLGLIFMFIRGNANVLVIPILLFITTLPIVLIYLRILRFKFKLSRQDFPVLKTFFSSSLIIWAISLFAQVYNGFDIALMGWMRPSAEVGYFTVARRFIAGITFFALFLASAALPRYAASFKEGVEQFKANTSQFVRVVVLLSALLWLGLVVFSKELIVFAVGHEYLAADFSFKILMVGVIFVLFNLPFSTALVAAGLEKEVLKQAIASAVLNVGLNLYLIPKWGMEGASLSFVYAEALAVIWVIVVYRKKITVNIPPVKI